MPRFQAVIIFEGSCGTLANNKPSERSMKESILKHHLLPMFGDMPLDAIKMHANEILKADLLTKGLSRKRVNNVTFCPHLALLPRESMVGCRQCASSRTRWQGRAWRRSFAG